MTYWNKLGVPCNSEEGIPVDVTAHWDAFGSLRNQNGPYIAPGRKGRAAGPIFLGRQGASGNWTTAKESSSLGWNQPFCNQTSAPPSAQGCPSSFLPGAAWRCQQHGQQKSHKRRCGLAYVTFGNWQKASSPENGCAQFGAGAFCSLHEESRGHMLLRSPSPYRKQRRSIQCPHPLLAWCDRGLSPSCLILMQTRHSMTGRSKSLQASGLPLPPLSALDRAVPRFGLLMSEKLRWERLWKSETEVWDKCSWIASYGACSHLQSFVIAKNGALQIPWRDWRQTYASHHQEVCLDSQPRSKGSMYYLLLSSSPPLTSFP